MTFIKETWAIWMDKKCAPGTPALRFCPKCKHATQQLVNDSETQLRCVACDHLYVEQGPVWNFHTDDDLYGDISEIKALNKESTDYAPFFDKISRNLP